MTTLTGNITNVLGSKLDGTVSLAAHYHRPVNGALVLADWVSVPLENSHFTAVDVEPGPARLRVEAGSVFAEWDIVIPDDGPVDVADVVLDDIEYPEPVVLAAQAASRAAQAAAERAEAGADRVGSAEVVLEARDQSQTAAGDAIEAAGRSNSDAGRAKQEADRAAGRATAAGNAATASATSAGNAKTSETNAAGSATTATTQAGKAKSEADRAANAVATTTWTGDVLSVNGKSSPPLTGPQGRPGDKGDKGDRGPVGAAGITANTTGVTKYEPQVIRLETKLTSDFSAYQIYLIVSGCTATLVIDSIRWVSSEDPGPNQLFALPAGTIPPEYRPGGNQIIGFLVSSSSSVPDTRFDVVGDGSVRLNNYPKGGDSKIGTVSWPVATPVITPVGADPESLKAEITNQIAGVVDGAPESLNTLREIAEKLAAQDTVAEALTNQIAGKASTEALTSGLAVKANSADVVPSKLVSSMPSSPVVGTLYFVTGA